MPKIVEQPLFLEGGNKGSIGHESYWSSSRAL